MNTVELKQVGSCGRSRKDHVTHFYLRPHAIEALLCKERSENIVRSSPEVLDHQNPTEVCLLSTRR